MASNVGRRPAVLEVDAMRPASALPAVAEKATC